MLPYGLDLVAHQSLVDIYRFESHVVLLIATATFVFTAFFLSCIIFFFNDRGRCSFLRLFYSLRLDFFTFSSAFILVIRIAFVCQSE